MAAADMPSMPEHPKCRLARWWDGLRSGLWLGFGQYGGNYDRMNQLYRLDDPWKLSSARERARFALTNEVIVRLLPGCQTLLEIGSGEGMQTAWFQQVSRHVTGVEVSPIAAERAIRTLSDPEFLVGRAEEVAALFGDRRFDLITACEILYYAADVPGILAQLQQLAPRILVTNYEKRALMLGHHFTGPGWSRLDDLVAEDGMRWHCHVWSRPAD